jgi:hypothetical protein
VLGRREVSLHLFYPVNHSPLVRHPNQLLGIVPESLACPSLSSLAAKYPFPPEFPASFRAAGDSDQVAELRLLLSDLLEEEKLRAELEEL